MILTPKELVSEAQLYTSAVSMTQTEETSLVLYEYKVYATDARIQKGLDTEVPAHVQLLSPTTMCCRQSAQRGQESPRPLPPAPASQTTGHRV